MLLAVAIAYAAAAAADIAEMITLLLMMMVATTMSDAVLPDAGKRGPDSVGTVTALLAGTSNELAPFLRLSTWRLLVRLFVDVAAINAVHPACCCFVVAVSSW